MPTDTCDADAGTCELAASCDEHCHCTGQDTPCPFHNYDPREV